MKLTTYTKQAIVSSILNDLPTIDTPKEKVKMQEALVKAMSPEARKLYKTHPKALLNQHISGYHYGLDMHCMFICGDADVHDVLKPWRDAQDLRNLAKSKLASAVNSCSTLKQLSDRMPEFARYYPTEAQPTKNLPALIDVAADLCKLGWPVARKAT